MLSLISGLTTPAPLPYTRSVVPASAGSGTQLPVDRTPGRAADSFSISVGTTEAADIGALAEANRNSSAAASLLQVADKGLTEVGDALTRMKALAKQASTTAPSINEGAILNAEFDALRSEIDRVAENTAFNDIKVLKGIELAFKVGTGGASQDSITVSLAAATAAGLNAGLASDKITSATAATTALTNVTSAIDALRDIQSTAAGAAVRFQSAQRNLSAGKNILSGLRTSLLERPVTIGTADNLVNLVREELLAGGAPAAVGMLSSGISGLLSTTQVQPSRAPQTDDRADPNKPWDLAAKRSSTSQARPETRPSSQSQSHRSVDIEV